jgi:hypothetical protein
MTWRSKVALLGGVLTCAVLLYVLVSLVAVLGWGPGVRIAPSALRYASEAQRTARAFEFTALPSRDAGESAPPAEIAAAMESSLFEEQRDAWRRAEAPELGGAIAAVVAYVGALGSLDAASYGVWRRARGFEFVESFPMPPPRDRAWYEEVYRYAADERLPTGASPSWYFRRMYDGYLADGGGALRPTSIATSAPAVEAVAMWATHPADHLAHAREPVGSLGTPFWHGGLGALATPFWVYEPSMEDLIERDGGCWIARIRCVVRGGTGAAIPMWFSLLHDPAPERGWRVVGWAVNNVGRDVGVTKARVFAPVM